MSKFFRKYWPFVRGEIESTVEYRMSFIIWFMIEVLYIVVAYFTWRAIFNSSPVDTIRGYTFATMVVYLFLEKIVFSLTFMQPHWYITDDIKSGSIAMQLIKPINYQVQLFFRGIGTIGVSFIFFILPFIVLMISYGAIFGMAFTFTINQLIVFIISIIFGTFINFLISYCFGMIVFFTIGGFGIWQLKKGVELLLSGSLIPLVFFPEWFQTIAYYLPFSKVIFIPIRILMGDIPTSELLPTLGNQFIWIMIMLTIAALFWRKATKRLVIMGG